MKTNFLLLFALSVILSVASLRAAPVVEINPARVSGWPRETATLHEGREVARAKPVDLAEILSRQSPAFAAVRKGPVAGDFLLRGLGRENIAVTLDNCEVQGACPNRMDPPAFHVSSQQIRRVVVRTGPFDVATGSSVGGTVRVETTIDPAASPLTGILYLGQFDSYGAGFQGQWVEDATRLGGGVFYQEAGVYEDGSGQPFTAAPQGNNAYRPEVAGGKAFQIWNALARAEVPLPRGDIHATIGYNDARDVLYPGLNMDGKEDLSWRGSLVYRHTTPSPVGEQWQLRLAGSQVDHDMTDGFRVSSGMNPAFARRGYMMRTEARTRVLETAWKAEKSLDDWSLRYGTDYRQIRWLADNVIMRQRNDFIPDVLTRRGGVWASGGRIWEDWQLDLGGRFDLGQMEARRDIGVVQGLQNTRTNRQMDVLPAGYLLVSRPWAETHRAEIGLGHGYRQPSADERYRQLLHPNPMLPNRIGDPDLSPTRSTEVRGALVGEEGSVRYRSEVFHSWLTDYIYPVGRRIDGRRVDTFDNIDARLWGFTVEGSYEVAKSLLAEAGVAWQRGRKESLASGMSDSGLGEIPPLQGRVALAFNPGPVGLLVEGLFADGQSRLDREIGEQPIAGWAVLNLQLEWVVNDRLTINGGIDNVFDREYAVHNAFVRSPFSAGVVVNEPGRFLYLRATIGLGKGSLRKN